MKYWRSLAFAAFFTFVGTGSMAQRPDVALNLTQSTNENIFRYAQYSSKSSDSALIYDIQNLHRLDFNDLPNENLVLPTDDRITWVTFQINNNTSSLKTVYLTFSPSYLGDIKVYNNRLLVSQTGTLTKNQLTNTPGLSARVSIPPGTSDIAIRIASFGTAISIQAQSDEVFQSEKSKNEIIFFFLLGAIAVLSSYHLFIFFTSREFVYLYYVLYGISLIGAQLTLTNFNRYFLDSHFMSFPVGYLGSLLFANLGYLSIAQFSWTLLQLETGSRWKRSLIRALQALAIINVLSIVITEHHATILTTRLLGLSTLLALIAIGITEAKKGNKTAKLFLFSWTPLFVSIVLVVMVLNGTVAQSSWTNWSLSIGAVFESLILAMAIGNRLERATREKLMEQNLKIKAYEQIEENFEKLRKRDEVIRSFVSPTILTEVALKKDPLQYKPQFLEKSIMFTDLRGYTSLTERLTPAEAGEILNSFFRLLNESIFEHNGEVDKLIGDAVMATFSSADDCLCAIISFRNRLATANKSRLANGQIPIRTGTGITHGTVLSANFGTQHKLDRTIVGDVVNLSSRLEGLSKEFGADIIASDSFINALTRSAEIRPLNWVQVKGRAEPVLIYEIYDHAAQSVKDYKAKHGHAFKQIIELQRNKQFSEALALVEGLISNCPPHTYLENEILDPTLKKVSKILRSQIDPAQGAGYGQQAA